MKWSNEEAAKWAEEAWKDWLPIGYSWLPEWENPGTTPGNHLESGKKARNHLGNNNLPTNDSVGGSGIPLSKRGDTGNHPEGPALRRELGPLIITAEEWAEEYPDLLVEPEKVGRWFGRRGELEILAGRPFAGKSTVLAQEAGLVASRGHRVLWLSYEEGIGRIVSRLYEHSGGPQVLVPNAIARPEGKRGFKKFIDKWEPDLLIVDSVFSMIGRLVTPVPDDSQGPAWQAIFGFVKDCVADNQTALLMIAHMGWSNTNIRGSSGIEAAADCVYRFTETPGTIRNVQEDGRWGSAKYKLQYDPQTGVYSEKGSPQETLEGKVAAYLQQNPEASGNEVCKYIPGRRSDILKIVRDLS